MKMVEFPTLEETIAFVGEHADDQLFTPFDASH